MYATVKNGQYIPGTASFMVERLGKDAGALAGTYISGTSVDGKASNTFLYRNPDTGEFFIQDPDLKGKQKGKAVRIPKEIAAMVPKEAWEYFRTNKDAKDRLFRIIKDLTNTGFGKKPVMSIQEVVIDSEEDIRRFCIYTPHEYFEVEDGKIVKQEPHILGTIPIIEYPANNTRIGAFELVLQLLDAINLATSNRLDGIEQFIQSFMKFINVRIDKEKYEQLKEEGALLFTSEPGNPADVGIVSSELNQSQTQIVVDHLYQMVLIICGMPDRQGNNRTTGDTGQAVMLRDGWAAAESKAKETESSFKKSEKKFLKYILSLEDDLQLKVSDIDIKFTRNKTDNLLTKTQGLQNMLEAGVTPQIAFSLSNLFSDPEQACKDSEPYLQKWVPKKETEKVPEGNDPNGTPANNKPNPKEE